MKPSLDVNSMKEFCIQHVEKFVFGGVVLLLLLFAVRAVGTIGGLGPDFSPEELSDQAKAATNHWSGTDPRAYLAAKGIEVHPYGTVDAPKILEPIPPEPFVHTVVWNAPISPPRRKREEPALMAIKDLRASAGHGAMQATSSGSMGRDAAVSVNSTRNAQGRRWVVVTGLIDIQAQMEAYKTQFEDAVVRNWQRDVPMYLGYRIERAEVTGDEDPEQLARLWKPIKLLEAFQAAGYSAGGRELVDRRYFPPQPQGAIYPMVFPLPPLIKGDLGPEVAHYPEIPLAVDMPESERGSLYGQQPGSAAEPGEAGELQGAPGTEAPGKSEVDEFAGPMAMRRGAGGEFGGSGMPGTGGGMYGSGMPGMPGGPSGGMGGSYPDYDASMGAEGSGMPGGYGYGMDGRTGAGMRAQKPVEYQLFRFFDFDVEPGNRYRYRVKAVLKNPNYKLPEQYVLKEELGAKYSIEPDGWSESSDTATVPYDSRLVAGPVKAPPTILYEPSAQVVTVTLRMEDGFEASQDYTVYRGHLANFEAAIAEETRRGPMGMGPGYTGAEEAGEESSMGYMPPGMGGAEPPPRRRAKANEDEEEEEKIEHATNMLVLDIDGGDRLHGTDRSLTEPGSLLLMGPDGSLIVRNELDDQDDYLAYHVEEERRPKRKEPSPMDGMMPGMEGDSAMEGMDMYGLGADEEGSGRRGRGRRSRGSSSDY